MHPRISLRHSTRHTVFSHLLKIWLIFKWQARKPVMPARSVHLCVACLSLIVATATLANEAHINNGQQPTLEHKQDTKLLLPAITQEHGRFTVFDSQLREHIFQQDNEGRYSALNASTSALQQATNGQFQWTDSLGRQHRFAGSSTILSNDGECSPSTTTQLDKQDTNTDPADPPTQDEEPQQCDTDTEGPHVFQPIPSSGQRTTLDARPESCESYFVQYYGTKRGFEIEAGLQQHAPYNGMQPTVRNFPVIDFIDDSTLYVVHSRDLGNRTFNSPARPDALLDQLLKDGEEIQTRVIDVLHEEGNITATELGKTTTITEDQLRPVTLQLVIRDGIASADHWRQIEIARERLMRLYGITLEVVVIP